MIIKFKIEGTDQLMATYGLAEILVWRRRFMLGSSSWLLSGDTNWGGKCSSGPSSTTTRNLEFYSMVQIYLIRCFKVRSDLETT